jgi:hypothetical protein
MYVSKLLEEKKKWRGEAPKTVKEKKKKVGKS